MVQQQIKSPHKKWKHMVGVMCLNLTYRKHVKIIFIKTPVIITAKNIKSINK